MRKERETEEAKARAMIAQLSTLLDPVGLTTSIMEDSKYGKRKHPRRDPWGYTRDCMAVYAPESDPEAVIRLFEGVGAHDDHQAARWLLKYDRLVQ